MQQLYIVEWLTYSCQNYPPSTNQRQIFILHRNYFHCAVGINIGIYCTFQFTLNDVNYYYDKIFANYVFLFIYFINSS